MLVLYLVVGACITYKGKMDAGHGVNYSLVQQSSGCLRRLFTLNVLFLKYRLDFDGKRALLAEVRNSLETISRLILHIRVRVRA